MGWKTHTILVRPAVLDGGPEKLLGDLGYDKVRKVSDTPIDGALQGSIWIGMVDDCAIIYSPLAGYFFAGEGDEENQEFEVFRNVLLRRFSEADIAVLSLHSVVGHWGFAIFHRGTLIRRQHGYDGMVIADEGSRLPVEEAYLSKFDRHDVDGVTRYRDPRHPEYGDMGDPDFGEELVFEICRSFTGFPLDRLQADGTNFWLNDDEEEFLRAEANMVRAPKRADGVPGSRPWWKFWN
ncbi:hypothetical protein [Bradyrhizobium sp. CB3481]|uniref:DUF6928 family protein n=1 Tax=Bradyrhizobium sp. CB3481 TaxID=3039158 RepID=UPI0024B03BE5|nr:hypothetical protein [Bradyrhizobium sp. CB3481]WFU15084.1 hypothetical protein QA643_29485 [Bradyrhizobium sp. CB3481]